ncbi:MAG: hypothetical protein HON65_10925 [Rhodospirillales bacterium]|nr:hypothetical protein [Rhodospirillales bacterium]
MPERPVKQCAVVVFTNQTALPWLRLLSCGFRHCFVAVEADCGWIVFDPLSNVLKTNSLAAISSQELANWYRANGYRVMISYVRDPLMRPAPWALFTCVEAVKRLLGIHSRWVVTPWQLWKFLNNENNP